MRNRISLSAISAGALLALALLTAPLRADEPAAQKGFTFKLDPVVISILDSHIDTDSAKWSEYKDTSNGFTLPLLHITGESADHNRTVELRALNVRRTDARYTLDYGVAGSYNLRIDYNKIPHRFGNDGRMLWTRTGDGVYEIADPTQQAIQTALEKQFNTNKAGINFNFLNNLLAPYLATATHVDLGLQRDRALARLDLGRMGNLGWTLEYTHENRRGNRPYGAGFGFSNATELPEPIDYDTTGAELAGEWKAKQGGMKFGYRYSDFKNNIETLIYDNPFRFTDSTDANAYTAPGATTINGAKRGFAALAPSNRAGGAFVSGQLKAGGWWLNGSATYNTMKQDESLLPYTLNTSIVGLTAAGAKFDPTTTSTLPVQKANNKVNTSALTANAGTKFGDFDFALRYRYYDYDDKSEEIVFPGYVRFNAVWEAIGRIALPFSYKRQNAGAELGWNLSPSTRFGLVFDRESWDRDKREVKKTDENVWKLTADTRPSQSFTLRGTYEHGDRTISAYDTEAAEESFVISTGATNQPGLRKYDEAARTYNSWNILAQFFPVADLSLSLGTTGRKDKYDKSQFGLISDDIKAYSAELAYTPGANVDFFLFGQRSDRSNFLHDRQSNTGVPSTNPLDDWTADFSEITDTWGLGFNSTFAQDWKANVTANWTRSDGKIDFSRLPAAVQPLDINNYENIKLVSLLGRLDYKINSAATFGLFYRWEKYQIDSFIRQGLANYLPAALLLNANNGDYQVSVYGANFKLSF